MAQGNKGISLRDKVAFNSAQQRDRQIEHAVVSAKFLAGNRIELSVADAMPVEDSELDAEFFRRRAISAVASRLRQAWPRAEILRAAD